MRRWLICAAVAAATGTMAAPDIEVAAAERLKMTMNWTADSAHLGFALAETRGYYAKEGLDVTFEEGRGSSVAAQLVATGQTPLGYADAGAALKIASQGAPIRIIATIWKSSQFGIQFLESSGIEKPADLKGKKLSVAPGSAMVALVPMFLKANGLTEEDVTIVSAKQEAAIGLLASGQIDAIAETPENVVVPLARQGLAVGNMYFYEYGVPLVSLSLIAREDRIAENPDLYRRFVRATLRGWRDAIEEPEAAVDALLALFPETRNSKEDLLAAARYSFSSVCPGGSGDVIGYTPEATWNTIYEVMTTALDFPTTKPIEAYYTLDLLPEEPITCP